MYGVMCNVHKCVIYVVETGEMLYQRLQSHLSSIRCRRMEMEVPAHFNALGHSITNVNLNPRLTGVVSITQLTRGAGGYVETPHLPPKLLVRFPKF